MFISKNDDSVLATVITHVVLLTVFRPPGYIFLGGLFAAFGLGAVFGFTFSIWVFIIRLFDDLPAGL